MEGNKVRFSEIFDDLQKTIDKMPDPVIKKIYCAACITVSSMIINKTDPKTDSLEISFDEAFNDIQSFKVANGI